LYSQSTDIWKWFEEQLKFARELKKPVFLHERNASKKFLEIMQRYKDVKACVHCFTGTKEELQTYIKLGYYIGITGFICDERRNSILKDIVKLIPLDKLMIETDAPFMTPKKMPKPFDRVRRNEPAFLPVVLMQVAKCMGKSVEEVAEATRKTTIEFFGIDNKI
jgi:TatD DNase family protein